MNGVKYKNDFLMRGSQAYAMYEEWQKSKGDDRNKLQKKLDTHLKSLDQSKEMMERQPVSVKFEFMLGDVKNGRLAEFLQMCQDRGTDRMGVRVQRRDVEFLEKVFDLAAEGGKKAV